MSKTICANSGYGFMRLERQSNNPSKKTINIYTFIPCHRNPSIYNLNCNKMLVNYLIIIVGLV